MSKYQNEFINNMVTPKADDDDKARLQAENERLRAFVEGFIEEAPSLDSDRHWWVDKWYEFADEAAALLASLPPGGAGAGDDIPDHR